MALLSCHHHHFRMYVWAVCVCVALLVFFASSSTFAVVTFYFLLRYVLFLIFARFAILNMRAPAENNFMSFRKSIFDWFYLHTSGASLHLCIFAQYLKKPYTSWCLHLLASRKREGGRDVFRNTTWTYSLFINHYFLHPMHISMCLQFNLKFTTSPRKSIITIWQSDGSSRFRKS